MDIQVGGLEQLEERVTEALDRIGELQAGTWINSDSFFAEPFMQEHTEYDSFTAFCEDAPWSATEAGAVDSLPDQELNAHVTATTEFDDWEAMKTCAAEEEIVAELVRSG
mgnify:CR=1 FL=1